MISGFQKDIVRPLTSLELSDIRARENREGSPYSDRDMLLDHVRFLTEHIAAMSRTTAEEWERMG